MIRNACTLAGFGLGESVRRCLLGVFFSCVCLIASGQQPVGGAAPGATLERNREAIEERERRERARERQENIESPVVDEQKREQTIPPDMRGISIDIRRIEISASSILSAEDLRTLAVEYEGRTVTIADLHELVSQINQLYIDQGQITSRAVLPPQSIRDGVIHIELIEGRLGEIQISGSKYVNEGLYKRWVRTLPGELVDVNDLERNVLRFNALNDMQMRALLKSGKEHGTTDFVLAVQEPKRVEAFVYVDNAGRKETGRYRGGLTALVHSPFRVGDRLRVGGDVANGSRGASVAYEFPLNARGTRLELAYDYSDIDIIEGPLVGLNISGDSFNARVVLHQPLLVRRNLLIRASLGVHAKESQTDFNNTFLLDTDIRTIEYGVELESYDRHGSWFGGQYFVTGLDGLGGDDSFFVAKSTLNRYVSFSNDAYLYMRGNAQFSDETALPSTELFQVGGIATVRGYEEGLIVGDNGYFLSAELGMPLMPGNKNPNHANKQISLGGFLFADFGSVFKLDKDDLSVGASENISSVGFGFTLQKGQNFSGRLTFGLPLVDLPGDDESYVKYVFNRKF